MKLIIKNCSNVVIHLNYKKTNKDKKKSNIIELSPLSETSIFKEQLSESEEEEEHINVSESEEEEEHINVSESEEESESESESESEEEHINVSESEEKNAYYEDDSESEEEERD